MLGFIIFITVVIIIFKFLGAARKRVDAIKNETFHASYTALQSAQNDLNRRIDQTGLDPIKAKKIFDKRTKSILRQYGMNAYGDEAQIPLQEYSNYKDYSRKLRKKFNKRVEV